MSGSVSGFSDPASNGGDSLRLTQPLPRRESFSSTSIDSPSREVLTLIAGTAKVSVKNGTHPTSKTLSQSLKAYSKNPWIYAAIIATAIAITAGVIVGTGGVALIPLGVFGAAAFTASLMGIGSGTAIGAIVSIAGAIFSQGFITLQHKTDDFKDLFKGCKTMQEFESRAKEINACKRYVNEADIEKQLRDKLLSVTDEEEFLNLEYGVAVLRTKFSDDLLRNEFILARNDFSGMKSLKADPFLGCETVEQFESRAKLIEGFKSCLNLDQLKEKLVTDILSITEMGDDEREEIVNAVTKGFPNLFSENEKNVFSHYGHILSSLEDDEGGFDDLFSDCLTFKDFNERAELINICRYKIDLDDAQYQLHEQLEERFPDEYQKYSRKIEQIFEHLNGY